MTLSALSAFEDVQGEGSKSPNMLFARGEPYEETMSVMISAV